MTNNAWTLLKHTAGSVNKAAGNLDRAVYGPVEPPPAQPPHKVGPLEGFGYGLLAVVTVAMFFAWMFRWQGRVERVKTRIFGED